MTKTNSKTQAGERKSKCRRVWAERPAVWDSHDCTGGPFCKGDCKPRQPKPASAWDSQVAASEQAAREALAVLDSIGDPFDIDQATRDWEAGEESRERAQASAEGDSFLIAFERGEGLAMLEEWQADEAAGLLDSVLPPLSAIRAANGASKCSRPHCSADALLGDSLCGLHRAELDETGEPDDACPF